MRILCFIDNLGSGGAQRQLVNLALGFQNKGHEVSFLVYHQADFYLPLLQEYNIHVTLINPNSYIKRIWQCRRFIRRGKYDVVLSFLETPSFIAEVAAIPSKHWKLIVGERSSSPSILRSLKGRLYRFFHLLADYVVSNSYTNKRLVKQANPLLKEEKNKTIYNTYELDKLNPTRFFKKQVEDDKFHLVIAASHQRLKNLKNLAYAVNLLSEQEKSILSIDWYGNQVQECFLENMNCVVKLGLQQIIHFYPPTLDIYQKMVDAKAVGLFSIYEGLSNTICEAMCLGKPVITTDVSDNRLIIDDPQLISDANLPSSIAKSLSYLLSLSNEDLKQIGINNRRKAEKLFDKEIIVNQYLTLMQ